MKRTDPKDSPDELLFGRFEVHDQLGTGAHAEVFKVVEPETGKTYALKVLTAENDEIRERTYQEGIVLTRLRHPNIVHSTEVIPAGDDVCYLMQYIEGPTLRQLMKDKKLSTLEEVLELFKGCLAGIEAAHRAGVMHRDLKPSNILCDFDGKVYVPKVIDFGAAQADAGGAGGLGSGTLMGTPGYMAPEQLIENAPVGPHSDVFALGSILYELIARRPAYRKKDPMETVKATVSGKFRPLEQAVPGLPPGVSAAVNQALNPDPTKRHRTCDDFAVALYDERLDVGSFSAIRNIRASPAPPKRVDPPPIAQPPQPVVKEEVVEEEDEHDWIAKAYIASLVLVGLLVVLGLLFYSIRFLATPA